MKKFLYLLLLIPCISQSVTACSLCESQVAIPTSGNAKSGGAARQAEGGDWGQTMPAYRGEGAESARLEGL